MVSEIVTKLMAKNADHRYQGGHGLKADMAVCLHRLKSTGEIEDFPLGLHDRAEKLIIPQDLYGRDREWGELRSSKPGSGSSNSRRALGRLFMLFTTAGAMEKLINIAWPMIVEEQGYKYGGNFFFTPMGAARVPFKIWDSLPEKAGVFKTRGLEHQPIKYQATRFGVCFFSQGLQGAWCRSGGHCPPFYCLYCFTVRTKRPV